MSDCKCLFCSNRHFTVRSSTLVTSTDVDLSNFLASSDYADYITNFTTPIISGEEVLVTFNNTTVQALWLPTIIASGEKQVLFTFYKLGRRDYLSFVINSRGILDDLLDMSGDLNLWLTDNTRVISATFARNALTSLANLPVPQGKRSILKCMKDTIQEMGPVAFAFCLAAAEECLLIVGIDCAYEHLMAD